MAILRSELTFMRELTNVIVFVIGHLLLLTTSACPEKLHLVLLLFLAGSALLTIPDSRDTRRACCRSPVVSIAMPIYDCERLFSSGDHPFTC